MYRKEIIKTSYIVTKAGTISTNEKGRVDCVVFNPVERRETNIGGSC